jgi:S1-C subfamily serine protease
VKGFIVAAWMLLASLAHAQTVPVDAASGITAKIQACAVRVQCPLTNGNIGYGSGVAVLGEYAPLIVTNFHVVDGATSTSVCPVGGKYTPAKILRVDEVMDLAVLEAGRVTKSLATPALFRDSHVHRLAAFGKSGNFHFHDLQPSTWKVNPQAGGAKYSWHVFKGGCGQGDSGGGIFNARGEVVGVVWGSEDGKSYAVCGVPFFEIIGIDIRNLR